MAIDRQTLALATDALRGTARRRAALAGRRGKCIRARAGGGVIWRSGYVTLVT